MQTCKRQHPLTWCMTMDGYMSGTFRCDICNKNCVCTNGRLNCSLCRYDICQNCMKNLSPAKDLKHNCRKGHMLSWSNSNVGYSGFNYICDNCKASRMINDGRWNCMTCKYDICPSCRMAPSSPAVFMTVTSTSTGNKFKCSHGHLLEWSESSSGYMSSSFSCDCCKSSHHCNQGRWNCRSCKYDVCMNCRAAPESAKGSKFSCRKGHQLVWSCSRDGYGGSNFVCDNCKTSQSLCGGRWNCLSCKYDICSACRSGPGSSPFVTVTVSSCHAQQASSPFNCDKGHTVEWSCDQYPGNSYICNVCKRSAKCSLGRWFCRGCHYDVCPSCRASPVANNCTQCRNGHPLVWCTDLMGYSYDNYVCDVCRTTHQCTSGRWNCRGCKYDLCPACRKPEPPAVTMASYTQCRNGHPLQWRAAWGGQVNCIYSCETCGKQTSSAAGMWNCSYCNYNVCPTCRSPGAPMPAPVAAPVPVQMPANPQWCRNSHPLEWSYDATGYMGGMYSCDLCRNPGNCSMGRFCCRMCRFDVCQSCRPQSTGIPPMGYNPCPVGIPRPMMMQPQPMAMPMSMPIPGMIGMPGAVVIPPLPNNGMATPTACFGGYNPTSMSVNDYISVSYSALKANQGIAITHVELWTNPERSRIVYMGLKYIMPNFGSGVTRDHGVRPMNYMLPHETLEISPAEYITNLSGWHNGNEVTALTVYTSLGRSISVGTAMGTQFDLAVPAGRRVVALASQFSAGMHNIGAYYV